MTRRRITTALVAVLALAALGAPGATAGKPTIERIAVDESGPDPFLTAACGFPVTYHAKGSVTVRTFAPGSTGIAELRTLNLLFTVSAGDRSYSFRDVGADHVQIGPDGTTIVMIVGQIPFGFTGVLKLDAATGDAILEPQHSLEDRIEHACTTLAP